MLQNKITRRGFVRRSVAGLGLGAATTLKAKTSPYGDTTPRDPGTRLPREVWIASFALAEETAGDYRQMAQNVLKHLDEIVAYQPDIVCLPETFPFAGISKDFVLRDAAEKPLGDITGPFAEFAKANRCYLICPVYTREGGSIFNAAVVIGRKGELLGEYRKIHPTEGEIEEGVAPGPLDPPVFRMDFGTIGIQICFDIQWSEGWKKLRQSGAEIVFWPSAFAGGIMVNTMAWQNQCVVVSSTQKDAVKICDRSGEEIARTGRWDPHWACAAVNLEKAFLHTWPYANRFKEIHSKYGRKVRIKTFHEEEWSMVESVSPDVKVKDILKEFELKTLDEVIQSAEQKQTMARGN